MIIRGNRKGITLIEMMIVLVIFATVIAVVYGVLARQFRVRADQEMILTLTRDLRNTMNTITADLRNADRAVNKLGVNPPITISNTLIMVAGKFGDESNWLKYEFVPEDKAIYRQTGTSSLDTNINQDYTSTTPIDYEPISIASNIKSFNMTYYDTLDNPLNKNTPLDQDIVSRIRRVEIEIVAETPVELSTTGEKGQRNLVSSVKMRGSGSWNVSG